MASGIYNRHKADLMNGEIDLEADTIKVMLLDNNHSFSATDNVIGDVDANEISGTGYTAGGGTLDNKSVTQASTTKWDADDEAWTGATITAYHAVIYDDSHGTDDLIASFDLGGAQSVTAATLTLQWDTNGITSIA